MRRAPMYAKVRSTLEHEHLATLERRAVIERRKEEAEKLVQLRLREEEAAKKAEEAARKAEEDRRLDREQKMREREKLQRYSGGDGCHGEEAIPHGNGQVRGKYDSRGT